MPISSVILSCRPNAVDAVREMIDARERSEVRDRQKNDLVVVIHTATLEGERAEMEGISMLPGVVSYCIVFNNAEGVELTDS